MVAEVKRRLGSTTLPQRSMICHYGATESRIRVIKTTSKPGAVYERNKEMER
jgi:hypothetical protein